MRKKQLETRTVSSKEFYVLLLKYINMQNHFRNNNDRYNKLQEVHCGDVNSFKIELDAAYCIWILRAPANRERFIKRVRFKRWSCSPSHNTLQGAENPWLLSDEWVEYVCRAVPLKSQLEHFPQKKLNCSTGLFEKKCAQPKLIHLCVSF